jgi:hypothetical protein
VKADKILSDLAEAAAEQKVAWALEDSRMDRSATPDTLFLPPTLSNCSDY